MNKAAWMSAAALAALLGVSTPAFAQSVSGQGNTDPRQDQFDEVDEIVVTARQRGEALTDVPVAVSVATAEQLERDQVFNLVDLQRTTPALEVSSSFGGNINGGAGLRGIRTQAFNPSVSPSVALVVDQAASGNVTFPILHDLAQVEVLRGPQGTLFGQGASAGVVSVTTRAPRLDSFWANFGIDYADNGTAGSENTDIVARAGVNIPLGSMAALRVSGIFKEIDGLRTNAFLNLDDRAREFAVRGRLLYVPTDRITVHLIGDYGETDEDGVNFFGQVLAPQSTRPFGPPGSTLGQFSQNNFNACGVTANLITTRARYFCEDVQSKENSAALSLTGVVQAEVSDRVSLTSVTSYRDLTIDVFNRNFGGRAVGFAARDENLQNNFTQFSQEVRLAYQGDTFDVIVGGFFNDFSYKKVPLDLSLLLNASGVPVFGQTARGFRTGFSVCQPNGPCNQAPTFVPEVADNQTIAVFADATMELSEKLELFGGLRFTDYSNDSGLGRNTLEPTSFDTIEESNVSGRIGVSYQPTPDTNVYASYSRGYKPSALGFPGDPTGSFILLDAEENSAFEVGAKADIGGLQLATNVFHMTIANFQGQSSVVNTFGELISQVRNLGDVKSYGFEVSAFGNVTDNLSVNAGYQYNHATYPTPFLGDDGTDLSGEQLLVSPRHKFVLSGEYVQPLSGNLEAFLSSNVIFKSEIRGSNRDTARFVYPADETLNLRLGVRDESAGWTASIFARNFTQNREPSSYLATVFGGQDDGGARARPVSGQTTRLVGLSFGYEF